MRFGSDSGWRPVERIDALAVGTGGIHLVRAIAWTAPCQPTMSSITMRRLFDGRRSIVTSEPLGRSLGLEPDTFTVDDELAWFDRDGTRGLRVPPWGLTVSVRLPRRTGARPVIETSRILRRVRIRPTPAVDAAERNPSGWPAGTHPGVYTRWPLRAEPEPDTVLGVSPARIATGPAALFRDAEDRRLVG